MKSIIEHLLKHDKTQDLYIARKQYCYSCPCHGEWVERDPTVMGCWETALDVAVTFPAEERIPTVYYYSAETGEVTEITFNYHYSDHRLHSVTTSNGWRWCDNGWGGRIWRNENA